MTTRPKGKSNPRRQRDQQWLVRIRNESLPAFIPTEPEPPQELFRALEEFNAGDFFRCHETLEALWLKEGYPLRLFYHGLLKTAVGCLHLTRRNRHGAVTSLESGLEFLEGFPDTYMSVEVAPLRESARRCLRDIEQAPAGRLPATLPSPFLKISRRR